MTGIKPIRVSKVSKRRTQQERTAATTRLLLDATVKCIKLKGYSSTSISQIIKEAGVSRGALLHHYPSKLELVASAINDFYCKLGLEVDELIQKIGTDKDSLKQRLDVVREIYSKNTSARIEFMVAARTDPELAKAIKKQQDKEQPYFFPQLSGLADAYSISELISAFLLGNSLMAAWDTDNKERAYDIFVEMLEHYVARHSVQE